MSIKGFQGTSLLDFPGRVASLVFYGGCNLRCPYCHNAPLVETPQLYPDLPTVDILAQLKTRQGFIDGVVISGGEPTLDADLPEFLAQIKQMGLQVKLDTNGLRPQVLAQLLTQNLVDFVGLDIKTALSRYGELHTGAIDGAMVQQSIDLLLQATIEVEFRTTCAPGLVEEADIRSIGEILTGQPNWVLQQFVATYAMAEEMQNCLPHSEAVLNRFAEIAGEYVEHVVIRGV